MENMFLLMEHDQELATKRCVWINGPLILEAGRSGLALAVYLMEKNIPFVLLSREDYIASLWQKRTYDRLKLHLPKQYCKLPKMPFWESFLGYPMKRQFAEYLELYASPLEISPNFNKRVQTNGLWRFKSLSDAESTRKKVGYISRWGVGSTGEKAEGVLVPENEGISEFTGEMSYYINWKGTQALDRVLQQKVQVCYAISLTRQLGALLRLKGLLEPHESLSIQYVINETGTLLFQERLVGCGWDGSIPKLEMLTALYTQHGIVLEDLAPLTYSVESTNDVLEKGVRRFKAAKIIHHYLDNYNDDTLERKLLSFLMVSPVSVVVRSCESFWGIKGTELYYPTEADISNTSGGYHAILLTGAGRDENGIQFWECQDSVGDKRRGDRGFIRIAMGRRVISQFVEMSIEELAESSSKIRA